LLNARRLTTAALSLLTLAIVGCGQTGMNAVMPTAHAGARTATIMANGAKHTLGYNVNRYQTVLAPKAHPKHLPHQGMLPSAVDNRKFCSPVADQGQLGSCTAFSMGKGMREYLINKNAERANKMSALWLYYEERKHMGSEYINEDSGANINDGMAVLSEQGNAVESTWPYITSKFSVKPPQAAYDSAAEYKIHDATELASLDDVKAAIAKGQPVAFGFIVYSSFQWIGSNGVMPMPKPSESELGGHAVLAVGYDDAKKALIVRNSWGAGWGDHGYFYMPYAFAADKDKAMEWFTASK
jgi:C1A family cysteine protease